MPAFGPISRRELLHYLRRLGFAGPLAGTRHQIMVRGSLKLRIPNPHQGEISRDLLVRILSEAGISRDEWESL
ncbi:MAG: type II toxin-antitoxin system HicA family toxin [Chloroflexi bacterium]|nr:type II toxin-antitoxin system HicA family toxin [Chloroflexota bacterium]